VVIAIIGILAAMISAAVVKVRAKARYTECGSQLRQIGLAITMYATENDDYLPAAARLGPEPELPRLRDVLAGQIDTPELWHCPADTGELSLYDDPAIQTSYEWNSLISGRKIDRATFRIVGMNIVAPIARDAEAWHPAPGRNYTYTDAHITTTAQWEIAP